MQDSGRSVILTNWTCLGILGICVRWLWPYFIIISSDYLIHEDNNNTDDDDDDDNNNNNNNDNNNNNTTTSTNNNNNNNNTNDNIISSNNNNNDKTNTGSNDAVVEMFISSAATPADNVLRLTFLDLHVCNVQVSNQRNHMLIQSSTKQIFNPLCMLEMIRI